MRSRFRTNSQGSQQRHRVHHSTQRARSQDPFAARRPPVRCRRVFREVPQRSLREAVDPTGPIVRGFIGTGAFDLSTFRAWLTCQRAWQSTKPTKKPPNTHDTHHSSHCPHPFTPSTPFTTTPQDSLRRTRIAQAPIAIGLGAEATEAEVRELRHHAGCRRGETAAA